MRHCGRGAVKGPRGADSAHAGIVTRFKGAGCATSARSRPLSLDPWEPWDSKAHATTQPGAHRSGRTASPGQPVGGPETVRVATCSRAKWGRWTRAGRGCRSWAALQSDLDHHRPGPVRDERLASHSPGQSPGAGWKITWGPRGQSPLWRDPGPTPAQWSVAVAAEPHPGPH